MTLNWEAVGAIAEFVGALAVLITLIYLATQIRNQNRQSRDASSQWGVSQFNALRLLTMQNEDVARVMLKGFEGSDALDPLEELQFFNSVDYVFATLWSQFQSVQNGTSELTEETLRSAFGNLGQSQGVKEIWRNRLRHRYPEEFRHFIDDSFQETSA